MANLQAVAHGRLLGGTHGRPAPGAFVTALNRDIRGRFGDNRYATMFYGEFDSHSGVLRYVSAGHCPPIFISEAGKATVLPGGDLPVGLFADAAYQERRVTVSRGCAIVVYTDGATDALNSRRGFRRRKGQEMPHVVAKRSKRRDDLWATRRES